MRTRNRKEKPTTHRFTNRDEGGGDKSQCVTHNKLVRRKILTAAKTKGFLSYGEIAGYITHEGDISIKAKGKGKGWATTKSNTGSINKEVKPPISALIIIRPIGEGRDHADRRDGGTCTCSTCIYFFVCR